MSQVLSKGQQISSAVAIVTSTAVSPLVGVCVLGIWEHFHTPKTKRDKLPLYTRPAFWIPIGILLILILIKDTSGGFAPLIKKPLDAIEVLMVNKASLFLIALPIVFHQVARLMGVQSVSQLFALALPALQPVAYAADGAAGTWQTAGNAALAVLLLAVGMITATAVWLVGHALDVLTLLSPFPFFDLLLKGFRNAIFATLAVTTLINRQAGLVASLVVIVVCLLLVGWAFRLAVFGAVFSWELLRLMLLDWRRKPEQGKPVSAFSAASFRAVAPRSFGRILRSADGGLVFRTRRLGWGPGHDIRVGEASRYELGKGLLNPSVVAVEEDGTKHRIAFRLLPTYVGSEQQLRDALGLAGVRDIRWTRGLRNFWRWLSQDAEEAQPA